MSKHRPFKIVLPFMLLLGPALSSPLEPAFAQTTEPEVSTDGIQRGEIIVDSYSYSPNELVVKAGLPVELTLKSVTRIVPHSFVIQDEAAGLSVREDVPAGKEVVVRFTPAEPGEVKFYCDKKLLFFKSHQDKGMTGTLHIR